MKNIHKFYLVTFLLSLNSVIFCSVKEVSFAVQTDPQKLQNQKTKTTIDHSQQDWAITLQSVQNKHAKPQPKNNMQKTAPVFPAIAQQENKKDNSSTSSSKQTNLPTIKNASKCVHCNDNQKSAGFVMDISHDNDDLPCWVHESPTSIASKQLEQGKELPSLSHVFIKTQKTIDDNQLQAQKWSGEKRTAFLLKIKDITL